MYIKIFNLRVSDLCRDFQLGPCHISSSQARGRPLSWQSKAWSGTAQNRSKSSHVLLPFYGLHHLQLLERYPLQGFGVQAAVMHPALSCVSLVILDLVDHITRKLPSQSLAIFKIFLISQIICGGQIPLTMHLTHQRPGSLVSRPHSMAVRRI